MLGEELTVIAIGPNRGTDYAIYFTAASASAKKGAQARDITPAILTNIKLWESEGAWELRGPITTIAQDGTSIMNAAVFDYVTQHWLNRSSAMGKALFGEGEGAMLLFFNLCGHSPDRPIVDVCDDKHWMKRLRMAIKRSDGITIKHHCFNRRLLTRLLVSPSKFNPHACSIHASAYTPPHTRLEAGVCGCAILVELTRSASGRGVGAGLSGFRNPRPAPFPLQKLTG